MKTSDTLTIFITPLKGEEIRIEKACTLKQAVTLAKKEARKLINNGGMWVTINIQARASYGVETLAHIEAEKQGRRVAFSDEQPAETYAVCWGDEYKEEDGESNAIATTTSESDAKEIALNESRANGCTMSVVRMSDKAVILLLSDEVKLTNESAAAYNALCSSFVDTYTPTETPNPENNTPSTMNANEVQVPEFSELSHTATNIVLTAENDGDIYRRHVAPLVLSLTNKIKRGITPDSKRLAQSSVMRSIIAAALAEMYCAGWMEDNTKVTAAERKEAANYLAWSYISDAEDEYNNQMAVYR